MLIKQGSVIELGGHRLACGDCRDDSLVKKLIDDNRISLVITDPPYGVGYVENKAGFAKIRASKVIANDNFSNEEEYKKFSSEWLSALKPYLASKNSLYIFNSDKMIFALKDAMDEQNIRLAQILIWIKNNAVIVRRDFLAKHELIIYGWHGTHQFYKSKDSSVLFYPKPNSSPLHPTTKPLGLLRRLILNSSQIGGTIYDPFAGSGTTLIAAEQTGRKCLAIEIDPDYCNVIINRFKKLKGEK